MSTETSDTQTTTPAATAGAAEGGRGRTGGRRQRDREKNKAQGPRYITRKIPFYEVLSQEGLDKLERQAQHLLAHPECSAHFCNARIVRGDTLTDELWTPPGQPTRASLSDIWQGNPYPTAGAMLWLAALDGVPEWYDRMQLTDWPLYVLAATTGELHFDPAPAACYRLHEGGAFSALSETEKLHRTDEFYREMNRNFSGHFVELSRAGRSHLFHDWAQGYLTKGDVALARTAWRMSLAAGPGKGAVPLSRSLRLGWRIARRSLAA